MKRLKYHIITLLLISYSCLILPQSSLSQVDYSHFKGLQSIESGNYNEAIKFFKFSVDSFANSESYFQLAKLYFEKNSVESRALARDYIQKAIWNNPQNISYRLLQAQLMEKFGRKMAYDVYKEILDIDKNNTEALWNLGRIKEMDFYEYNNSVLKVGSDPSLSFDEFAAEDFVQAEEFFKKAIKSDSSKTEAYFHLSYLYEEIEEPQKGIPLLKKVIELEPENKEAHTYLGLLFYKCSELDSAYSSYKKALELMDDKERREFKFHSASLLLSEDLRDEIIELSNPEMEKTIEKFWQVSDPLLLTNYNERLLEHYSRVAYSNLRFSVPENEIYGWETDRGEILIRYGEPGNKLRYRPHISAGGRTSLMLKTDLWFYEDKVLGFVDEYWNGNFRFSTPRPYSRHLSQFAGDTDFFVKDLRRNEPENYKPKFEGPSINVPFNVVQFKNMDETNGQTDVYINYALNLSNQFNIDDKHPLAHKYGLFFLNSDYEVINKQTNLTLKSKPEQNIKLGLNEEYQVNSILLESDSDSGKMAFEIIRLSDNSVSANHFNYSIRAFEDNKLQVSDIILAEAINEETTYLPVKRGNLNILPNPLNEFTPINNIYIYYEVYNLQPDTNSLSNFEQRVTIFKEDKQSDLENILNSVTNFFGFTGKEDRLTLTTNYKSLERSVPLYFQLDMSKYESGEYILQIEIEDLQSEEVVTTKTHLRWR